MKLVNILNLLGGLGLFLFGMQYMSSGLSNVAGGKMKKLLEKLTNNPVKGFFVGMLVTAVIQSSSATTVMLMGFLNAGIMDLAQATGVIIGAQIGTTITAVLIALDVSVIAPVCIFIGAAMFLFSKKQNKKYIGQIILGFGILFFGLKYMSGDSAMGVLKSSASFQSFITRVNNPFVGIIIGILMCSVLQSSSASIGVLQVLALKGLMPLDFSMFMIIGINVGSATPLFLSAIGAKTNARRAAVVYFIFDFVGMLIFTPIALFTPFISWVESLSDNGSVQVAAGHIIFKVVTALILLPFVKSIVKITEKIVKPREHETELRFYYIDKKVSIENHTTILQVASEVERMAEVVRNNFAMACEGFIAGDISKADEIRENEELINWLNHNITDFVVTLTSHEQSASDSEYITKLLHVITDLERVGDHAINILERTEESVRDDLTYSPEAMKEFTTIYEKALELYDRAVGAFVNKSLPDKEEHELHAIENSIDDLTEKAQERHVERLRHKECGTLPGVIFTKLLQDLERVGDHAYNIAWDSRMDNKFLKQV